MAKTQNDEIVMGLVELAESQPPDLREACLRTACGADGELFREAWEYVQWNDRMRDFLLDPLCSKLQERPPGPAEAADDNATRTMVDPPASEEYLFFPGDLLLSRFRIVREVARGGMGIVYEARDEKLGRRIALKCARSGFHKRLPPEVRHASEIAHPNVCRIFEIHTAMTAQGEIDFLTMEFVDGETLRARLSHGPMPEAEALAIGRQICAGVAEAHRKGVVHGDLKSSNVILARDANGNVRAVVTDFGLARGPLGPASEIAGGVAGASEAGGTPGYMAPELLRGEKPSVASDVYALGVTLYELVANRRPYPSELPSQHRIGQPPPPLRHKWNPILQRCLDPDPSRRFRDAGEVAAVIEPAPWRRWWMAAAAAIVLAAAASGIVTYQRATAPKESIRLAMLPLESGPGAKDIADRVVRDTMEELAKLKGGTQARLSIIPRKDVIGGHVDTAAKARTALGATHVLSGTLAWGDGKVVLHTLLTDLTDARTSANRADWTAIYAPGEERYAGKAITGVVTFALRLDPLKMAPVNSRARQDYLDGLKNTRRNSTVDDALPRLDRAVKADPDSPLTWAGLAEAQWFKYFITKNSTWLDRSSESVRQAQNRNLDLAPVHRVNGLLLSNANSYQEAEEEYLRAIELEPDNGDAYRRLGRTYLEDKKKDRALEMYKKAVAVQPNDFKTHQDLGSWYSREGDYDKATPEFEKCLRLAPDDADPHRVLGGAYRHLDRFDEAERELRKAVEMSPTPIALGSLAAALMYMDRNPEAISYLQEAVRLSPDDSQWLMALGIAYARTNQPDKSENAFRLGLDAAEKTPSPNGQVLSRVAFLSARLHDGPAARYEIKNALELSKGDTAVQETAIYTYDALGDDEKAVDLLEGYSDEVLHEVAWWPDLAGLHENPRFKKLVESRNIRVRK
ncbi:MAG: tetratricopeptide repeat protein [Opitutaceae bacterium]|jgi:tetratricopeptide (TPR) repeat protein